MKNISIYMIQVSTRGPIHTQFAKSGHGVYLVVAKDTEQAVQFLKDYFKENNLFGSIYKPYILPEKYETFNKNGKMYIYSRYYSVPLKFGEVIDRHKYLNECEKFQNKENYRFIPKKTEKGLKIHKISRPGIEYRERNIQGAFGNERSCSVNPERPEMFEDCINLHNINGITYEGRPLNYDNMMDEALEQAFDDV